jgi:Domain of unknown function (DUF1844)
MEAATPNPPTSSQRFVEFVKIQAQQVLLFLGKIPNPSTGKVVQNFEAARLFIDQLEMLQEKTSGNLSLEESEVLNVTLSEVRFAYIRAVSAKPTVESSAMSSLSLSQASDERSGAQEIEEKKKKFSKSYGS